MDNIKLPRGSRDYIPDIYGILEEIRDEFVELVDVYGYRFMEPSAIELMHVLEAKSGPDIKDEIFFFKDKGGREVGLRFDLTVGLTRYYCSDRSFPKNMKLAAFGGVWRYEEPQRGRYRWFYQWDVEIFGPRTPLADAEVVSFTHELLERIGLKEVYFIINDRRLTENMIKEEAEREGIEAKEDMIIETLRSLDKVDKKGMDELLDEYGRKGYRPELLERVIERAQGLRGDIDVIEGDRGLTDHLEAVAELMHDVGIPFRIDPTLARGLDYYTSFVFEVRDPLSEELGSVVGGGRYDMLPAMFGRPNSGATGAAGGVDRLIEALRKRGRRKVERRMVAIVYSPESVRYAFRVARILTSKGISVDMPIYDRTPSIRRIFLENVKTHELLVIAGKDEMSKGTVKIRMTEEKEEMEVRLEELSGTMDELIRGRSR